MQCRCEFVSLWSSVESFTAAKGQLTNLTSLEIEAEDKIKRSEVGGWRLEVGGWRLEVLPTGRVMVLMKSAGRFLGAGYWQHCTLAVYTYGTTSRRYVTLNRDGN